MKKISFFVLLGLMQVTSSYSSAPIGEEVKVAKVSMHFPEKFDNGKLEKLAAKEFQDGYMIYRINPDSKKDFDSFYLRGSIRRAKNGGAAEYFKLTTVADPFEATYQFSGAYYGQTDVKVQAEYDLFKLLNPSKKLNDGGLCLLRIFQFDEKHILQKDDFRNNGHLAKLCFILKALETPMLFELEQEDQDAIAWKQLDNLLKREAVDVDVRGGVLAGKQLPIGIPVMLKLAEELKGKLFEKIGVNKTLLQQQVEKKTELALTEELVNKISSEGA